ncbi:unnamed protein product [Closterium sp. NIES-54]
MGPPVSRPLTALFATPVVTVAAVVGTSCPRPPRHAARCSVACVPHAALASARRAVACTYPSPPPLAPAAVGRKGGRGCVAPVVTPAASANDNGQRQRQRARGPASAAADHQQRLPPCCPLVSPSTLLQPSALLQPRLHPPPYLTHASLSASATGRGVGGGGQWGGRGWGGGQWGDVVGVADGEGEVAGETVHRQPPLAFPSLSLLHVQHYSFFSRAYVFVHCVAHTPLMKASHIPLESRHLKLTSVQVSASFVIRADRDGVLNRGACCPAHARSAALPARTSRPAASRVAPLLQPARRAPLLPARCALQPARRALLQPARRALLPPESRPAAARASRPAAARASRPAAARASRPAAARASRPTAAQRVMPCSPHVKPCSPHVKPCCSLRDAPCCSPRLAPRCCPARRALLPCCPAQRATRCPVQRVALPLGPRAMLPCP